MKPLNKILEQLFFGEFEFTRHGLIKAVERNISDLEIKEAGKNAIIIESYPKDKYSPSCLLLGYTKEKRPLHIQVSSAGTDTDLVKIITIYEPDNYKWIDNLRRR